MRDERLFTWRNFFLRCDAALKLLHKLSWHPLRRLALAKAESWMVERMGDGSDGLAAVFPAMLNSIIALKALGYEERHPLLQKAVQDFEGLFVDDPEDFRIQPCLSPVWDTAINIIALGESGLGDTSRPLDQSRAMAGGKGSSFPAGDWKKKNPHPEGSGWAFEFNNVYYPDTDDTMMVLDGAPACKT